MIVAHFKNSKIAKLLKEGNTGEHALALSAAAAAQARAAAVAAAARPPPPSLASQNINFRK